MARTIWFYLEYALVRLVAGVLRRLTIEQASAISAAICGALGPWTKLHRRALANLADAFPEAGDFEHRRIAKAMWRNTGRTLAETILFDRLVDDHERIKFVNGEKLTRQFSQTNGFVGATLHLGNWELATWACTLSGGRLVGVYKPQRNPLIDRYLRTIREPHYPDGLHHKGTRGQTYTSFETMRSILQHLRRGGHIGFVCDEAEEHAGVSVPFFSYPATFSKAPARMARNARANFWVGCCFRSDEQCRFRFEAREIAVPLTDDPVADVKVATADMVDQFEQWIIAEPEQWMWWLRKSIRK